MPSWELRNLRGAFFFIMATHVELSKEKLELEEKIGSLKAKMKAKAHEYQHLKWELQNIESNLMDLELDADLYFERKANG